jgi:hypothetical protein
LGSFLRRYNRVSWQWKKLRHKVLLFTFVILNLLDALSYYHMKPVAFLLNWPVSVYTRVDINSVGTHMKSRGYSMRKQTINKDLPSLSSLESAEATMFRTEHRSLAMPGVFAQLLYVDFPLNTEISDRFHTPISL